MTDPFGAYVRLADTLFTPPQFQFFQAGIRQGFTRTVLRDMFHTSFEGKGFGNAAFAAGRALLTDAQRAGIEAERLRPGQRLGDNRIPYIERTDVRGKYQVNGTARYRLVGTDEYRTLGVTFHTDELVTPDALALRSGEILDAAESHYGNEVEFIGFEGLSITRAA